MSPMERDPGPQAAAPSHGSAGFTLVELLIVALLGSLILGATYQVLVTNQRIYTVQREQVQGHGTVRAGLEVLTNELREVSPTGGDLLDLSPTSVEVRVMRSLGLVCIADGESVPPRFTLRPRGGDWEVGDEVAIFADNDPASADDDVWLEGTVANIVLGEPCPGDSGTEERVRIDVLDLGILLDTNTVHPGAPVRSFETHTYGLIEYEGRPYLGRTTDGDAQPLVGPLADVDGIHFEYLASDGSVTTDPQEVRRIEITLQTRSQATDAQGRPVEESITTSVYLRN